MKLRNTVLGVELPLNGEDWILVPEQPPDRWVDVTSGCEYTENAMLCDMNAPKGQDGYPQRVTMHIYSPYRLRKVKSCYIRNEKPTTEDPTYYWAFIVERRTP